MSLSWEVPRQQHRTDADPIHSTVRAPCEVYHLDFTNRAIHLSVIDFEKVSPISFTQNDVDKKLVPALLANYPYYPRPDVDEDLWSESSTAYLGVSSLILEQKKEKNPVSYLGSGHEEIVSIIS